MLSNPKSKKQKMNDLTLGLAYQWVLSLLPEDQKDIDPLSALEQIPKDPYFIRNGQVRINSFTFKWFRKKIKKVLKKNPKPIMSVTLNEVLNA